MQLELFTHDEGTLRKELEHRTGLNIDLTVTDNTSSLMTFSSGKKHKTARLRVHHMFLKASPDVLHSLATWLVHRRHKRSAAVLDHFIKSNEHLIRSERERRRTLRMQGQVHDLEAFYHQLNAAHFENTVDAPITWGRASGRARRRSIRLGSYTPEDHLIRIHPNLDQTFVPDYYVRYVVFHEMLHAYLGIELTPTGRRRIHSPEFKRIEKAYPEYDKALDWHHTPGNLVALMRQRPKAS